METEARVNILLVDDQPANLLALEAVLEGLGQNLVRARSGEEALRQLIQMDFAVILLDVLMPGMNGFETAAMIRERDRSRHMPIIFLTAGGKTENEMFQGYALGAIDYLLKPVRPAVLRSKVLVLMDLYRKTGEVKRLKDELHQRTQEHEALNVLFKKEVENRERIEQEWRRSEETLKKLNIDLEERTAEGAPAAGERS
jgi:CheY-like chemotaxis protein